jgi:hypothetical protein
VWPTHRIKALHRILSADHSFGLDDDVSLPSLSPSKEFGQLPLGEHQLLSTRLSQHASYRLRRTSFFDSHFSQIVTNLDNSFLIDAIPLRVTLVDLHCEVVVWSGRWKRSKTMKSLLSWKSPSKSGNERVTRLGKKMKSKSEKFSYANFKWERSGEVQDCASVPLKTALQSGLKLLIRENDRLGFDNCIIWLKNDNLEIWTPSTGNHQIIALHNIQMITKIHEENLLLVKCSTNTEYQFKTSDGSKLEQLRLLLKLSTAKTSIRSFSESTDSKKSDLERNSIFITRYSFLQDQTEANENLERSNTPLECRNSAHKLSLRSPNLNSPSCSKERIGARLRLRSRGSELVSRESSLRSEEPKPPASSQENPVKVSPKRLREEVGDHGRPLSVKKVRSESKKMKPDDDIIIGNETVAL